MANWYGNARSNYFKVTDLEAFTKRMEALEVRVVGKNQDNSPGPDGRVALLSETEYGDWPSYFTDKDTDEEYHIDMADEIEEYLADGEVAILMECGAEKLRYLTGWALAFNNKGERTSISIEDIYEKARDLNLGHVTEAAG